MQKLTSAADGAAGVVPVRVVIITLDNHLASTVARVARQLGAEMPGLELTLHAAADFADQPAALERAKQAIGRADIILATMLFMEDHIRPILPAISARRETCDAIVGAVSAGEVIKLTKLGRFDMGRQQSGAIAFLKRLRGSSGSKAGAQVSSGAGQMAMLRRIPKILRFIPGTAQDARAYFLTLQYWLAGSDENVANMVRLLVDRYAAGPRAGWRGRVKVGSPVEYPDVGVYHPRIPGRIAATAAPLPSTGGTRPKVGVLLMRSYVLSGNTAHYDAVIAELEGRGLDVVPAFSSSLDARPAVDQLFKDRNGRPTIDALVSLMGFSLVGGPAYNDAHAAEETLAGLDVPYIAAHAVEFQTLEQWRDGERGLLPIEATMMVAIPELDGATGSMVFGGRSQAGHDMIAEGERVRMLAARIERLVALRRKARKDRNLAIVLFNFPPNGGAVGTAAYLAVFESLHRTLISLKEAGYDVEVPASVDALRSSILDGNAMQNGTAANVHARVSAEDHVRRQKWLEEIERQWGPAPGRQQSDGRSILVLGKQFGKVFVGVQPAFGYEGDPMRLLFERSFAPTHAFATFYRYLREEFRADAVLHFGTHGALEFMPGKQTGLSDACWPDRLIGDLPNFYLYAANNPSEGAIAKRRSAATLVSYLTPPVAKAGLYRGLVDLKSSLSRWRGLDDGAEAQGERGRLAPLIQAQAAELDLVAASPVWSADDEAEIAGLWVKVLELEYTLIPHGLHVVGEPASREERVELLDVMSEESRDVLPEGAIARLVAGEAPARIAAAVAAAERPALISVLDKLAETNRLLSESRELDGFVTALDGRFVRPSPSGDLLRTPAILPTGRNIHGFDPFRMPSAFAMREGEAQAKRLIARHREDGNGLPARVAMVLWGSDNIKSEGGPIAQAMALMGARPHFDSFGRLSGADLIPLSELGRPRIDVVLTLSGIFRDLLPLQIRMLAEAAYKAAEADEPEAMNYIRRHALAHLARHGGDMESAALRVFSNAEGAYGSNVNHLVETGAWQDEDELGNACTKRKGFAYGRSGRAEARPEMLKSLLAETDLAYQNLESVELGVTTVDHYFDTLGGISRAIRSARGEAVPVYIGDQTRGDGLVRSLNEQVSLETRTRMLNPKWYEGLLKHGYEGVRQIEAQVTNTLGWSATTAQVEPWVYQQITSTFVLDPEMRERLASMNPTASARLTSRLVEAHRRNYWTPDADTLEALRAAGEELEDRVEGIGMEATA